MIDGQPARLLGRDVARRAHQVAGAGLVLAAAVGRQQLGDAEVEQLDLVVVAGPVQEHVLRLEVAVDDALVVRGRQRLAHAVDDAPDLGQGQRRARRTLAQVLAAQHLHHQEAAAVGQLAHGEHVDDAGVADAVDRARLLHEAGDRVEVHAQLGPQHLDRDPLADDRVHRLVHEAHAAFAEQPLDDVLPDLEAGRQLVDHLPHGRDVGRARPRRAELAAGAAPVGDLEVALGRRRAGRGRPGLLLRRGGAPRHVLPPVYAVAGLCTRPGRAAPV